MPDPPDPLLPSTFLSTVARLTWRFAGRTATGAELGTLADGKTTWHILFARSNAPGCVEWRIMDALPPRMSSWLISRATFAVLSTGRLNANGTIDYQGVPHRIVVDFDGQHNVATAEPA